MNTHIFNISNILSASRIILTIPVAFCLLTEFPGNRIWAAVFCIIAAATDFFDGYLARYYHTVTEIGKFVDPVADKIAIGTIVIILTYINDLPLWYTILIILRDGLILIGSIYIHSRKKIITQSNWPGKIAVNLIALVVLLAILRIHEFQFWFSMFLWLSVGMMILSFIIYLKRLFIGFKV
jgi:CDP-diacylglycerol--glycerol-3-phosphate 3-phosphatidyltransferase